MGLREEILEVERKAKGLDKKEKAEQMSWEEIDRTIEKINGDIEIYSSKIRKYTLIFLVCAIISVSSLILSFNFTVTNEPSEMLILSLNLITSPIVIFLILFSLLICFYQFLLQGCKLEVAMGKLEKLKEVGKIKFQLEKENQ